MFLHILSFCQHLPSLGLTTKHVKMLWCPSWFCNPIPLNNFLYLFSTAVEWLLLATGWCVFFWYNGSVMYFLITYYLDLLLSIESEGQLRTSLYDKRDDFNFHITNFPFLSSNIPSSPAYGVFISQLIRYARACSSYECFILRAARLSSKLLGQGYVVGRLKSSLRKFYGRYGDLIKHYEVSLSQMLHDILGHDHIQWHPQLYRHYTYLRIYYRTGH